MAGPGLSPASSKRWSWTPAILPITALRHEGVELEVLDAEEKRLAMLYFRWDEVAPLLRGLYARQLDGFGQEQAEPYMEAPAAVEEPAEAAKPVEEPAAEAPAFHSEPVTVYPGEQNHLPYDVVVERLHVDQPEPPAPAPNRTKTVEEKPENTRFLSRSTASGRPSPMPEGSRAGGLSGVSRTTCAVMPRTSASPMTT